MKTLLIKFSLAFALIFLLVGPSNGQVPQGFNYQAIARDGSSGNILPNEGLKIKIGILTSLVPATVVYEAVYIVTTNQFGLFQLIVGDPLAEPVIGAFSDVNWIVTPLYLRTKILIKGEWQDMGSAQLFSVPYALVSQNVTGLKKLSVAGETPVMDEALFEVKNNLGKTVFAVYNEGVRAFVGAAQKGQKGGFAIGGFGTGKADPQEYMRIYPDSARVYVKEPVKGQKGGFAIGSFNGTKNITSSFMNITPQNYFIGQESGTNITTGIYNSFLGYQAGNKTTTGSKNYFIGFKAGFSNVSGFSNTFIGDSAGYKNTVGYFNTFIGNWSGFSNVNGYKNLIIGHRAGYANTSGICNVFLGPDAGGSNTTAWYNTFVGIGAGYRTTSGGYNSYYGINSGYAMASGYNNAFYGSNSGYWFDGGIGNTFIGAEAGRGGPDNDPADPAGNNNTALGYNSGVVLESASNNTMVGASTGSALRTGTGNVFLGYQAGISETGSDKLYISNSSINNLIYGDFSAKKVGINTTTLNKTLNVGGDIEATGSISAASITAPLSGSVNGGTMNKVFLNGVNGVVVSINSDKLDLYWDVNAKTLTLRNNMSSGYCFYRYERFALGSSGLTYDAGGITPGTKLLITFSLNGDACEVSFNDENGASTCTVWLQYVNSKLIGHCIKY